VPKGAAGSRATRNVITMSNREIGASQALRIRVADLAERMRGARITENELKTFRKVAAVLEDGKGRIDADDLIAASFVVDPPD
jgi:predicted nucleic acid-binding protein